jgi:hypothetical protein
MVEFSMQYEMGSKAAHGIAGYAGSTLEVALLKKSPGDRSVWSAGPELRQKGL